MSYSDPYFPRIPSMRRYEIALDSRPLRPESVAAQDAIVVVTDHSLFPYEMIHESAQLVVDSRNAFASRGLTGPHVVRA